MRTEPAIPEPRGQHAHGTTRLAFRRVISVSKEALQKDEERLKAEAGEEREIMSRLTSMVLDSLRPNNGWLRPMRAADPKDRWKYYAIRFGFVILLIALLIIFGWPHKVLR